MNKKFLSAILFGALMVTSTGTFVSCKDYDDDIDAINSELVDIKSQLSSLQNQVNSGKYVTNVTKKGEGIVVTWNDGTTSTIETIKGDKGETGATGAAGAKGEATVITIDPVTKNWVVDGVDTGICSQGKDGLNGQDGKDGVDGKDDQDGKDGVDGKDGKDAPTPIFTVGEDSHIYVQYGEDGEKLDLGTSTGGIFYVDNGASYSLNICDENGEWNELLLPKTAAISSIEIIGTDNGLDWDDWSATELSLVYGQNTTGAAVTFNGKTYAKNALMSSAEAYVVAQINPTMANAALYNYYLTDSKGNSLFSLGTATAHKTDGPITRAATADKGLYVLPVTFKAGTTVASVAAHNSNIVYAIATQDIYGNEILSEYELKVIPANGTSSMSISDSYEEVEIGKALDLNTLVSKTNVIDVKYEFTKDQTAAVAAANASISGTSITGTVVGKSVVVTAKYLKNDGTVGTAGTITVKFIAPATENSYTKTIVPTGDATKDVVKFDLTSIIGNTAATNGAYTLGDVKFTAETKDKNTDVTYAEGADAVGFTNGGIVVASVDGTGYYTHNATFNVDAAAVIPGTYKAEVTYGTSPVNKITLTIVVADPSATFNFKPLALYFSGNNATAYGTPVAGNKINYDLTGLFGINDWTNIVFTETVPESYEDADGNTWRANAWLSGTEVNVDRVKGGYIFGGAYEARALKATYTPYANANYNKVSYDFNLTIKSAVYEGSLIYRLRGAEILDANGNGTGDYNYTTGAAKTIEVASAVNSVKLLADEIMGKTTTGVTYYGEGNAALIQSVSVALVEGDLAEQYLEEVTGSAATGWIIKLKANVTAPAGNSVTCKVRVSVLDQWGKTKTVDVPVTLK